MMVGALNISRFSFFFLLSVTITSTAELSSLQYIYSVVRFQYSERDVCHSLSKRVFLTAAWSL